MLLTSDLVRASATAAAVGHLVGLGAVADPRQRELHLGAWQGLTSAEAAVGYPDEHAAWRPHWSTRVETAAGWRLEQHNAGAGPL